MIRSLLNFNRVWITILSVLVAGVGLYSQINYIPLYTSSTLGNYLTDTTLPVGTVAASADVTNGSASYAIPLQLPAGTNGAVPSLSISYNSFGGLSHLGYGWSLNGLSTITRSLKTIYHDGKAAPVELNLSDKFAIDGSRLIATNGIYGNNGTMYSKEMQDFSRITSYGNMGGGPEWFKVEMKDGLVMEYGRTVDARFMNEANTTVIYWRHNKTIYPDGNYIEYKYDNSQRDSRVDEILFTGNDAAGLLPYNKVKFLYLDRDANFYQTTYEAGNSINTRFVLDKIIITT